VEAILYSSLIPRLCVGGGGKEKDFAGPPSGRAATDKGKEKKGGGKGGGKRGGGEVRTVEPVAGPLNRRVSFSFWKERRKRGERRETTTATTNRVLIVSPSKATLSIGKEKKKEVNDVVRIACDLPSLAARRKREEEKGERKKGQDPGSVHRLGRIKA